jgi:hypothetical protein
MTRPATYVTDHRSPPGEAFSTARRWRWYGDDCRGPVRTLYRREHRRWLTAGWLCLKCGTLELVGGLVYLEGRWGEGDPEPRVGILARAGVDTVPEADGAAGVDTSSTTDGLHRAAIADVDTVAIADVSTPDVATSDVDHEP